MFLGVLCAVVFTVAKIMGSSLRSESHEGFELGDLTRPHPKWWFIEGNNAKMALNWELKLF